MSVLLNNYKNIERLLDKYAYISDYWLHDLFDEEHPTDKANEDIMKSTLKALANYLYDNTDMQHLLVWNSKRIIRPQDVWHEAGKTL